MFIAVGLWLVPLCGLAAGADLPAEKKASCSGNHGTSVHFVKTPQLAADKAKQEEKLVFVLHVSGNFEDPKFT
jgi:hypothetical protein